MNGDDILWGEQFDGALAAGANAFMEKPISIDELISQIRHFTGY